jgi:radical SAM protein with 4Fe4S-binding SPASM domain
MQIRNTPVMPIKYPSTVMLEPTNRCTLSCPGCPTGRGLIKHKRDMTRVEWTDLIQRLHWVRRLLVWGFGEPTMHPELHDMIGLARKVGIPNVLLATNGNMPDNYDFDGLLDSGVTDIIVALDCVSVDSYRIFRKGGDYNRVLNSIRRLCRKEKKPSVEVQFIIMKHNEHEITEMKRLARELGADKVCIKTVFVFPGEEALIPDEFNRYSTSPPSGLCPQLTDFCLINSNGNVNACVYRRTDLGEDYVMGNIFNESFMEIWNSSKYISLRERFAKDRANMPLCNVCVSGWRNRRLIEVSSLKDAMRS